MKKIKAFFLLAIIIFVFQQQVTTYADENIDSPVIVGNLINKTSADYGLSGLEVFMSVPDTTNPATVAITETDGGFQFAPAADILSENLYVFTVVYENAVVLRAD